MHSCFVSLVIIVGMSGQIILTDMLIGCQTCHWFLSDMILAWVSLVNSWRHSDCVLTTIWRVLTALSRFWSIPSFPCDSPANLSGSVLSFVLSNIKVCCYTGRLLAQHVKFFWQPCQSCHQSRSLVIWLSKHFDWTGHLIWPARSWILSVRSIVFWQHDKCSCRTSHYFFVKPFSIILTVLGFIDSHVNGGDRSLILSIRSMFLCQVIPCSTFLSRGLVNHVCVWQSCHVPWQASVADARHVNCRSSLVMVLTIHVNFFG